MLSISSLLITFFFLGVANLAGFKVSELIVSSFIALFVFAFAFDMRSSRQHRAIATPITLGLLFRVFLLYFDLYGQNIYQLPNSGLDSRGFYRSAVMQAQGYVSSEGNFVTLMSWLVRIFGRTRLFLQFVIVLFSIVAILYVDKSLICLEISDKNRKRIAWLIGLLPNFAILSSIFLRESLVTMFIAIGVYYFVRWWTTGRELDFWFGIAACIGGTLFHDGAISVAVGMVAARVLSNRKTQRLQINVRSVLPALLFLVLFAYLFTNYADSMFGKMENVESIEEIANTSELGGSSYSQYVGNSSNPLVMLLFTPLRMIFFQFSPFFFQIRGLSDIIAMVFDSFFYLYVFLATLPYLRKRRRPYRTLILLFLVLGLASAFVFGWGVSNTGTALRHRNKMISIFMIQLALILESRQIARGQIRGRTSA